MQYQLSYKNNRQTVKRLASLYNSSVRYLLGFSSTTLIIAVCALSTSSIIDTAVYTLYKTFLSATSRGFLSAGIRLLTVFTTDLICCCHFRFSSMIIPSYFFCGTRTNVSHVQLIFPVSVVLHG